ncbi:MAG: hypothetical protein WAQ27_04465 [Candidatus Microsaccharimonas sp.]
MTTQLVQKYALTRHEAFIAQHANTIVDEAIRQALAEIVKNKSFMKTTGGGFEIHLDEKWLLANLPAEWYGKTVTSEDARNREEAFRAASAELIRFFKAEFGYTLYVDFAPPEYASYRPYHRSSRFFRHDPATQKTWMRRRLFPLR